MEDHPEADKPRSNPAPLGAAAAPLEAPIIRVESAGPKTAAKASNPAGRNRRGPLSLDADVLARLAEASSPPPDDPQILPPVVSPIEPAAAGRTSVERPAVDPIHREEATGADPIGMQPAAPSSVADRPPDDLWQLLSEDPPAAASGAADTAKPLVVSPSAAEEEGKRLAKRRSGLAAAAGRSKAGGQSRPWISIAGGSLAVLIVVGLLAGLMNGGTSQPVEQPRAGSSSRSASAARQLPSFESDLPSLPESVTGVRPMDAQEQARRREAIASFAEMGRAEEANLRAEEKTAPAEAAP